MKQSLSRVRKTKSEKLNAPVGENIRNPENVMLRSSNFHGMIMPAPFFRVELRIMRVMKSISTPDNTRI